MAVIDIGEWRVDVDVAKTRELYERRESGDAEKCTCDLCRNFVAGRESAFSIPVREFLAALGIDWRKEYEAMELGVLDSGKHNYMGNYLLVGLIESRPSDLDAFDHVDGDFAFRLETALESRPLVRLNFSMPVPWPLDATP